MGASGSVPTGHTQVPWATCRETVVSLAPSSGSVSGAGTGSHRPTVTHEGSHLDGRPGWGLLQNFRMQRDWSTRAGSPTVGEEGWRGYFLGLGLDPGVFWLPSVTLPAAALQCCFHGNGCCTPSMRAARHVGHRAGLWVRWHSRMGQPRNTGPLPDGGSAGSRNVVSCGRQVDISWRSGVSVELSGGGPGCPQCSVPSLTAHQGALSSLGSLTWP